MDDDKLIEMAKRAREQAHAPYSGFHVGAAVQDELGRVHIGCNVENASFPEGACAETNAIGAMVAAGGRRIDAIVALGGKQELEYCAPCGGCRQRILEFADENTRIIYMNSAGDFVTVGLSTLLPESFSL
jgi:cytidine deaminase